MITKEKTEGAQVVTDVDLSPEKFPEWEAPEIAGENAVSSFSKANEALDVSQELLKGLREKNQAWLKGEISGDVADQLRSQAALSARSGGIGVGSQMSRNLQARDFGLTSLDIQQKGIAQETQITQLQQGMAQVREQRSQFQQQMLEQSRQFGASLSQDAARTSLARGELLLKQEAFNAEQNMRLVELIASSAMSMTGQQLQAAGAGISDTGITSTFNNIQKQLETLLASQTRS
jgi:hypothetical protein